MHKKECPYCGKKVAVPERGEYIVRGEDFMSHVQKHENGILDNDGELTDYGKKLAEKENTSITA